MVTIIITIILLARCMLHQEHNNRIHKQQEEHSILHLLNNNSNNINLTNFLEAMVDLLAIEAAGTHPLHPLRRMHKRYPLARSTISMEAQRIATTLMSVLITSSFHLGT
jgi:hypothetical protein